VPEVRLLRTAEVPPELLAAARDLCDRAFGDRFHDTDWDHALGGWHALALEGAELVAHASVVDRVLYVDGRALRAGYVEAVATEPGRQGIGLGSLVMAPLAAVIRAETELGALSTGAHGFYQRQGWERWLGPTYVRREGQPVRTPEEDDGVMVLRHGPSRDLDLTSDITCDQREGDDW
jgi:aminoglycoside 2'-N-acetyltransferase I